MGIILKQKIRNSPKMQSSKQIIQTFKAYPSMPQHLQLRLLKHMENKKQATPEQVEAKLMRAEMLKQNKLLEKQIKNNEHNQKVYNIAFKKAEIHNTKVQLMKEIQECKMKLAADNASNTMVQKIV